MELVPKANVQSSRMNSTVNSAGNESAHNQSASSVPKLLVRKDQGLVQEDNKGVPPAPLRIGNNNKAMLKVSASNPPDPKPSVQEENNLRRSTRGGNQIRNTWIFLQSSLALPFGTQSHHTKVTFT